MEPKYVYKMTLFSGYHGSIDFPQPHLSGCFYPLPKNINNLKEELIKYGARIEITKDGKITCYALKDNSELLNKFNDIDWLKKFY
jgi:hypothetical protein